MIGQYLMFNRNCEEAIKVYKKAFDAKLMEIQKYGDMPPNPNFPIADADKNLVLHARFSVADKEIMCADSLMPITKGNNIYVTFCTKDAEAIQKAWNVLKVDGEIFLDLAPAFFARLHGSLCDKFGINWMFTCLPE